MESGAPTYQLRVAVDEVSLTFHAEDGRGLPIMDLQPGEVSVLDDGRPPREILKFQLLKDFPIRAGILMDTSVSMVETRAVNRSIAIRFAEHLLRRPANRAFVLNFAQSSRVAQRWTSDVSDLGMAIRNRTTAVDGGGRRGTALFDAVYEACLNEFKPLDPAAGVNLILLFSDGGDNASQDTLQQAVAMCQRSNTAIYAFQPKVKSVFGTGPGNLAELAAESGGRVFEDMDSDAAIEKDLESIEAENGDQYRIVYKPPVLRRDGAFHRVVVKLPSRVASSGVRSGYYAPGR